MNLRKTKMLKQIKDFYKLEFDMLVSLVKHIPKDKSYIKSTNSDGTAYGIANSMYDKYDAWVVCVYVPHHLTAIITIPDELINYKKPVKQYNNKKQSYLYDLSEKFNSGELTYAEYKHMINSNYGMTEYEY